MNHYMALAVGAAFLIVGGCGQDDDVKPAAPQPSLMQSPQPSLMQSGDPMPATEPTPPLPAPDVPKGAVPELPKPGQVNNHSSPAFKSGGETDKTK